MERLQWMNHIAGRGAGGLGPDGEPDPQPLAGMETTDRVSRRLFLRELGFASAGLLATPALLASPLGRAFPRTAKVVRTHHADATTGTVVNQGPVDLMVHAAIRELTGLTDTAAAWKSLFPGVKADHTIAIKINLSCGDVPTHPEVVNAIIDGLLMMDLDGDHLLAEHIIVFDHDDPFFYYPAQNGYTHNYGGPGVQYYGTSHASVGYDTSLTFPIRHGVGSYSYHHPSRIISQYCDYMINAAVIKNHSDAVVTMCLKNTYGSFDNIYDTRMHYAAGQARGEPELNRVLRDELGNKTKLFVVDGTLGMYSGGPGYTPPGHTPPNWAFNSVLVGFDPVAVDRIGTIKINAERALHGLGALNPGVLPAAAGDPYYLGTDDPAEIELVEIDVAAQDIPLENVGPRALALLFPYPNPTTRGATVRFHCAAPSRVELDIFDARGAVVRRLESGTFDAGLHRLRWDGRDQAGREVGSGVYFVTLTSPHGRQQERLIVAR